MCITINIVGKGFNLNNKIHSKYLLKEEGSNEKLTNLIEMHFLNLKRARELSDIEEPLIRWLLFIETDSKEERQMLAKNSPVLKILNEKIDLLSLSPKEKKLYESRMMLKSDIVSISNSQFKKGLEEGIREGSYGNKIETAKNCLALNMSIEIISKITGLSIEEIEKL